MSRLHLIKESLLATVLTLLVTFAISFIPLKNEFTKGIKQGFLGFDVYDLYYSGKHKNNQSKDANVVLVEIENSRAKIAGQILLLQRYAPAVIGIDAEFKRKDDSLGNLILLDVLNQHHNIVIASSLMEDPLTKEKEMLPVSLGNHVLDLPCGYIDFYGQTLSVIRSFAPFYPGKRSVYPAFTSSVVNKFSPGKFARLKERDNKLEIINYTGNFNNYDNFSCSQLIEADRSGQLKTLIPGKIVLLGFFDKTEPLVMDDLHFSPLNERVAGKSLPDLYGVEIHANILTMILAGNYAHHATLLSSYLIAGLITFLFLWFIFSRYQKNPHPQHFWFLLIQFFLVFVLLYLFLEIFRHFMVKFDLMPIMLAIVLCVESLWIYKRIAMWMNRKSNYQTVFVAKNHI